jgi:hypothetical protein
VQGDFRQLGVASIFLRMRCFPKANLCGDGPELAPFVRISSHQRKIVPNARCFLRANNIQSERILLEIGLVQALLMWNRLFAFLLLFACVQASLADQPAAQRPLSIYIVRTGEQLQAPHVLTYRMVEYIQERGRWIFPDVGYYDCGHSNDRQWFAGVGAELYHGEHANFSQEIYVTQEEGSAAHNQRSMWVWPVLDLRFTPRLTSQTVAYPTLPLNRSAQWGFAVDRSKLEYALRPNFQVGPGYASSKTPGTPWQNRPFLTTTFTNRAGAWEFWLERMPGGGQIQLRYMKAHRGY